MVTCPHLSTLDRLDGVTCSCQGEAEGYSEWLDSIERSVER